MSKRELISPFPDPGHDHRACVRSGLDEAGQRCQQLGLRLTPQRREVLSLILDHHRPVGAYELAQTLSRRQGRSIAATTIYRALEFLLGAGLVHRVESANGYIACGNPAAPHPAHLLICRQCGEVAEMADSQVNRTLRASAGQIGFIPDAGALEVRGLCGGCRQGRGEGG